ncbi:MAG: murein biosynthesis integral membrane protein MurJ [Proteobacteria bacterium]|nr:MAG: murein biosynthesis integral membrane protein MurJ [Pseudomonadota bacterium]
MIRHVLTVSTGTALSRLTGFVRDALTAALLGAGPVADAFLAAFQLVNVARRLLTEGALNAALVPAVLHKREREGLAAATAFAGRVLGTVGVLTFALAALLALAAPALVALIAPGFADERFALAVNAARLMLPYLAFVGPVAVLMGLLNARREFAFAAFAPVLFNLALIAVLIVLLLRRDGAETDALVLSVMVGLAGCLQLVVLGAHGRGVATPLRVSFDKEMRGFLATAWPGAIASAMPQLLILTGVVVASASPAAVAWIYFANRLIELPLGLVGVAMGTVLVSELSHARYDAAAFAQAQRQGFVLAVGLSLPAAAGLVVLAEPIVRVLFHHGAFGAGDVHATGQALALLALGLPAQVAVKTLSAAFFARGDTGTPLIATLAAVMVALIGAAAAVAPFGVAGIALALAVSAWGAAVWLGVHAVRDGHLVLGAAAGVLARIALAAAGMGGALAAALALWPTPAHTAGAALHVAVLIAGGIALYGALLVVFGAADRSTATALRDAIARGKDGASNDPSRTSRHGGEA